MWYIYIYIYIQETYCHLNLTFSFINHRLYSPLHVVKPFPEYPVMHVQKKLPNVSVQIALTWQGLLLHSPISKNHDDKVYKIYEQILR